MAKENAARIKKWLWIRRMIRTIAILIVVLVWTQDYWQSHIDQWHCGRIAAELNDKYGLVVRYGDPSEFYVPPYEPCVNNPDNGFFIEPVEHIHYALTALKGARAALGQYPQELIRNYLKGVFIAGVIKIYWVQGVGSYHKSWIYLSALKEYEQEGGLELYSLNFHHELSSLFLKGSDFSNGKWCTNNEPNFRYLTRQIDVIRAAAAENQRDPKEASSWYQAGFVDDYGMASMENDFNTYAELAMTHPEQLKQLADQYPRIKAKTWILARFYSSLAPELKQYFEKAGLTFSE